MVNFEILGDPMKNIVLRLACLLALFVLSARDAHRAIGDDLNAPEASERDAIIALWSDARATALDSVKTDPKIDLGETYERKLRRTYQMFRVILFLEAFEIHQETALLRLELQTRKDMAEREVEELKLRRSTLRRKFSRVRSRIWRLNADEIKGYEIKIDSKEELEQLDKIDEMKWKLPIDLTPRSSAA